MYNRFVLLASIFFSGVANAFPSDCTFLEEGKAYHLTEAKGYCLETGNRLITLVNLSRQQIETVSVNLDVYYIYNGEYVYNSGKFAIYDSKDIVLTVEPQGIIVARDRENVAGDVQPMAAPLAVFVKPAIAGAILGGMGVVGGNPNAGFRSIAIGAFSGAVAGVLTPIMGVGTFGAVAAGSVGISINGMCRGCH